MEQTQQKVNVRVLIDKVKNKVVYVEAGGDFVDMENVKDYIGIMEASRGSVKAKQVAVRLIPKYFKHFPTLSLQAIDRYVNLCKDEELEVRVQAIFGLPLFCQDTPKYIPKLVDVLGQLPPAGEYVERDAVQISLFTILCLAVKSKFIGDGG